MSTFEDLGLAPELLERLSALGYRRPTAFQIDAVPVLARGTTAAGAAAAGSGKTLALALGLAQRLGAGADEDGAADPGSTRALVLRPTDHAAAATAESLYPIAEARGLTVGLLGAGSAAEGPGAAIQVASPAAALAAVERSGLKLGGLRSFVVDGASAIFRLGEREAVETLISQSPREAQRVILSAALDAEVEDWLERHSRRSRRILISPGELAPLARVAAEFFAGPRSEWLGVLAAAIDQAASKALDRILVHCRFESEAESLADRLEIRGHPIAAGPDEPGVHVLWGETGSADERALSVSWGAPPDHESLAARTASAGRALVLTEPRELTHLRRLADDLELGLTSVRVEPPGEAARSVRGTLDLLTRAARERDLEPYLLLLEPLLEEMTPAEIAAAAIALLREQRPVTEEPGLPAWTRLRFAVGRRDNVRPGDLVGAITGEASVRGEQIGRIDIHESHSIVEVSADVAERVIRTLGSTTIRGRQAGVRVYRE